MIGQGQYIRREETIMERLTDEFVGELLKKQREYFADGKTLSLSFRLDKLRKLKEAILTYREELEQALFDDLGKSRQECYSSEIGFVLSEITHTEKHLKKWMKPDRVKSPMTVFPAKSYVMKQPYGSVLIIGPFNYPFQLLVEPLVAALSAGNCAVLSPSELTPNTAAVIRKMIGKTFSEEYVYCAEGGIENNGVLLRSRFDKIFFTGSINVGKIVMRAAAENLVPVTLELGGKSPVIVDETAKIGIACERIAWGKFMNAGQTCVAPDYVFVQESIFDTFIETLRETVIRYYGSDARRSHDYGRIVNARHMKRLGEILEQDKDSVVFGGETDEKARFIAPTVLCPADIGHAACMQDEIFGPLLPVFPYRKVDEAISYINAHEKPLALYIFSEKAANVRYILGNTTSGGVSVNDTVSHIINQNLPFGGVGQSGMGNYHGEYGFLNFTHSRSVLKRSTRIVLRLAFPPFSRKKLDALEKYMK